MSTFSDTKPAGGIRHLVGVIATALVVYAVAAGGFGYLIHYRAANTANNEIRAQRVEVIEKLVADAKKKLPKGEKPDNAALEKAADARLESDAKVKADFEKKVEEVRHHAEGGLFPLACFIAIASGVLGGLFGMILLIKRNKDAGVGPWTAFLGHTASVAFYALIAFLPVLAYLAHHVEGGLSAYIKDNTPLLIGVVLAVIGFFVNLVSCFLPSRKGHDDAHDHDGHEHGESCRHSH